MSMSEPVNEIARRFGQMFWGLLLVILDININHFDLLPDFIGYGLVAVGAGGLTSLSAQFVTARTCAWVLVFVALAALLPTREPDMAITLIQLGFNCFMMWFLLGGIMDYAALRARPDLVERASNRRIGYVILMCVATFLGLAARGRSAAPFAVVIVVCVLILLVMILHLIHRVRTELAT